MVIKCVDTFAGIGGFRLAAMLACESVGVNFVKSVEHDEDACKTYKANFGDDPIGDMRKIPPGEYPDHDLLLGGFPCQAFSRNGRIYNFSGKDNKKHKMLQDDDRSNLFCTLVEILKEKQPKMFVFENVKEIMTIENGDGTLFFDTLMSNLESVGYSVSPRLLDSSDFGLPQQRRRVYFAGIRADLGVKYKAIAGDIKFNAPGESDIAISDILEKDVDPKYLLMKLWRKRRMPGLKERTVDDVIRFLKEKGLKTKYAALLEKERARGCPDRIRRIRALRLAYESGEWAEPKFKTGKIEPAAILYGDTPSGLPRQQDKLYSIMGISPTIATFSTPCVAIPGGPSKWRILTPRECARLQGFPETFTLPVSNTLAYRQVGNAVSVPVAKSVIKSLIRSVLGL